MTGVGWRCVEAAASLLEEREREAVLGDLAEAEESVWRGDPRDVGCQLDIDAQAGGSHLSRREHTCGH